MVLLELGSKINDALRKLSDSTVVDDHAVDEMLREIGNALIQSDVSVKLVVDLRTRIKTRITQEGKAGGLDQRKLIKQCVIDELCNLLDPGTPPFRPVKGKANVIMFVGLQGAGKTTTITKMAHHYKKKGWKPALVCADTFRAGAFDQLKQNATKARIPFFGSYTETDPVALAAEGVEQFRKEGYELIIVDTSGRHMQEESLFQEMREVAAAVKPSSIVFVMDGSIGQAAQPQAEAFKAAVDVGSVIITKMDSKNRKGGGALSAVAATRAPVIFIGTGEHMEDLEPFQVRSFVSKLLGMGDVKELMSRVQAAMPDKKAQQLLQNRLKEGLFSLRDMHEQFENVLKMGPVGKMMELMPGMGGLAAAAEKSGVDPTQKLRNFMSIMDSMTAEELDNSEVMF
ncbi:MAG: signal recognition particle protein SRP54, partial [archaeon]|nr:signal recognition particle protein SRP54 [archaeon]